MEANKIFEVAKDLAKNKGRHLSDSTYVGACSVGGDFSIYRDDYRCNGNRLTINYSTGKFDDGSGEWEEVSIFLKNRLLFPKKKVYQFHRKVGKEDKVNISPNKDWYKNFEKLVKN